MSLYSKYINKFFIYEFWFGTLTSTAAG